MRVEVHSPDGLEAAARGTLEYVEQSGTMWVVTTSDAGAIVFLDDKEMAFLVASVDKAKA